jgi:hypothetical protein
VVEIIVSSPFRGVAAITSITPVGHESKRILEKFALGEGLAIPLSDGSGWQEMAGSSSKLNRKQEDAIAALLT